ncbi:calcium-binding protein [Thermococcus sp.]|uniref:calcium-binding protein n=1 Tax=Thermococcus sp. TaxID=35749 RepID=UPI0025CCEC36|nr:calcium-binding protein [Thermococcus sp.]
MKLTPLVLAGIFVFSLFLTPQAQSAGNGASQNLDTDGDGLSDAFEIAHESLPNNPDSDGDGLSDKLEFYYGSDPMRQDSDADHLTDGEEVLKYGTNPVSYDTDGDNLPDYDELTGRYLVQGVEKGTPSDPTTPDTDGDGLDDYYEATVLTYLYGDEERPFYTNPDWDDDGIPDGEELYRYDGRYPADALVYNAGMFPAPSPLFNTPYYLCFLSPDCDGDGLTDREELELGTLVYARDTDGDGLWDGWEVKLGTDPFNADTDGDGLSDYEEVMPQLVNMELTGEVPPWLPQSPGEVKVWDGASGEEISLSRYIDYYLVQPVEWKYLLCSLDEKSLTVQYGLPEDVFRKKMFEHDGQLCFLLPSTSPTNPDTDGDGLSDYDELHFNYIYTSYDRADNSTSIIGGNQIILDPTNPDTDGDGIPDGSDPVPAHYDFDGDGLMEDNACAFALDCDEDGVSDKVENRSNTDPANPDTDGDGLTDWQELFWYYTNPLVQDTDGDGFTDFQEVKAGSNPNDPTSKPTSPPSAEKPEYRKVDTAIKETPRPKVHRHVEFLLDGKKIKPDEFTTVVVDSNSVSFETKADPIRVTLPDGSIEEYQLTGVSLGGDDKDKLEKVSKTEYTLSLPNITEIGFAFVSFKVELRFSDGSEEKSYTYEFNIEARYKAKPEVKLVSSEWLNSTDVGLLYFECHHCKNVTISAPGALINGKPKRVIDLGSTRPVKYFYARLVPKRYKLPGEKDVGTIHTKYENSVEVLKTGKDIGVLTAKMVEARSLGAKITYGMVALAKGVKTIVGGVEAFIPEEEEMPETEGVEAPDSVRFDKEAFKEGLLDWVKEQLVDKTFDYVTEKAVQYANEAEMRARREKTTYHVTVKACNDYYCEVYGFTVSGYGYEFG